MKKILSLWLRFIRDFFSAIIFGTALSVVWFYIIALLMILSGQSDMPDFTESVMILIIFQLVSIAVCCFIFMFIKRRPLRRIDHEFIGNNFIGPSKKSRTFRRAHALLQKMNIHGALELFTALDSDQFAKDREEQAIISFYRARCYHILCCTPNAVQCYEKARDNGFDRPEMTVFLARAYAENGSTEKALGIYTSIMDTSHRYSRIARVETGQMYLKLDDAQAALKWFEEAIDRRQSYAESLGGAAIAHLLLNDYAKSEELYRLAILNNIENHESYVRYYKKIQAEVILRHSHEKNLSDDSGNGGAYNV